MRKGCDYQGHEFGAKEYPDSVCIDGFLWDADSGESCEGGWKYTHGGEIRCPKCNAVVKGKDMSLFYVVGEDKGQKAYYSGWWHTYNQPLFSHHRDLSSKAMSRANANRVRRRLENPKIWGGKWKLEIASDVATKEDNE